MGVEGAAISVSRALNFGIGSQAFLAILYNGVGWHIKKPRLSHDNMTSTGLLTTPSLASIINLGQSSTSQNEFGRQRGADKFYYCCTLLTATRLQLSQQSNDILDEGVPTTSPKNASN